MYPIACEVHTILGKRDSVVGTALLTGELKSNIDNS